MSPDLSTEGFGEHDGSAVVRFNGLLNGLDWYVWLIAEPFLPAAAQKIEVNSTVPLGTLHSEAVLAASAPDRAFEVMRMVAQAGTRPRVRIEDMLYAVEQLLGDERFVPSIGPPHAVVENLAEVVAIAEQRVERLDGHGSTLWPATVCREA